MMLRAILFFLVTVPLAAPAAEPYDLVIRHGRVIDGTGNLFLTEYGDTRVRRIDGGTGIITTVAGDGTAGFTGDGGAATSAQLD